MTVEELAQGPVFKGSVLWDDTNMKEATPSYNTFRRWIEVKCEDGRIIKGEKRFTAVREGQPKPKVRPEIAKGWIDLLTAQGLKPVSVSFKYRTVR